MKHQFKVNQRVRVRGKEIIRVVSAIYRVENFYLYMLAGIDGFPVREDKLEDAEPKPAPDPITKTQKTRGKHHGNSTKGYTDKRTGYTNHVA